MINNLSFILVVFLQLVMISICITKILDFLNYHVGHQKRLLVSVIVMILLQNILAKICLSANKQNNFIVKYSNLILDFI